MKHNRKCLTVTTTSRKIWLFCACICIPDGVSTEIFAYMILDMEFERYIQLFPKGCCRMQNTLTVPWPSTAEHQVNKEERRKHRQQPFWLYLSPHHQLFLRTEPLPNMRSTGAAPCQKLQVHSHPSFILASATAGALALCKC